MIANLPSWTVLLGAACVGLGGCAASGVRVGSTWPAGCRDVGEVSGASLFELRVAARSLGASYVAVTAEPVRQVRYFSRYGYGLRTERWPMGRAFACGERPEVAGYSR